VKKGSSFGCLSQFADPSLIADEHGAWERKEFREMTGMTPREYLAAVDVARYNDKFVYV
jgi:hypothetical protein